MAELKKFDSGAVRSADAEGYRYDLISPIGMRRLAETCHEGAVKYSPFNWEAGMDVADLLNHAIRHAYLFLSGDRSEDHLAHGAWGFFGAMHSEELWPALNIGKLRHGNCEPPGLPPEPKTVSKVSSPAPLAVQNRVNEESKK